jgi:type II secretory pathway pseudopilin PulG
MCKWKRVLPAVEYEMMAGKSGFGGISPHRQVSSNSLPPPPMKQGIVKASIAGNRCRPGFSLMELLVSTTIIIVLIALAFGALGKVRESARQSAAMASMKRVSGANQAYAAENSGRINMLRDTGESQQEGGPNAWVSNTFWGRAQPFLFSGVESGDQRELQSNIMQSLRGLFNTSDPKTMEGTLFHGPKIYADLSGLPVPFAFNVRIRPAWNQPSTSLLSIQNTGSTVYFFYGRYFVDEKAAAQAEELLMNPEKRRIYYLPNKKMMACFLDGRVEMLDAPAPMELFDPKP